MKEAETLERELVEKYGPYLPLSKIWQMLSYPSLDAARKSVARGTLPVDCITLPGRRGWFLRASDVSQWIVAALSNPAIARSSSELSR